MLRDWRNGEGAAARWVLPTKGSLGALRGFPTIAELVKEGRTKVVLASREITEVTAERIRSSAETAHLFEPVVSYLDTGVDQAAQTAKLECWRRKRTHSSARRRHPAR